MIDLDALIHMMVGAAVTTSVLAMMHFKIAGKIKRLNKVERRMCNWILFKARESVTASEILENWSEFPADIDLKKIITGPIVPPPPTPSELQALLSALLKSGRIYLNKERDTWKSSGSF